MSKSNQGRPASKEPQWNRHSAVRGADELEPKKDKTKDRVLLGVIWALSVALAFMLGLYSRPANGPVAQPAAQASAPANQGQASPAQPSAKRTPPPETIEYLKKLPRRDPNDYMAKGRVDAKVVLIEWSDYRCPYCAVWATRTQPALQKYIDNGTLRIEYRDMPLFGEQSEMTSIAARAAGQQGKFWEFHEAVYAAAPQSGHPDIPNSKLVEFAKQVGVPDIAKFEADLNDPALRQGMEADLAQATEMRVTGTPFFIVGTQPLGGAQPTEVFIAAIEQEAAK